MLSMTEAQVHALHEARREQLMKHRGRRGVPRRKARSADDSPRVSRVVTAPGWFVW
jgi:hypothetical protein